MSEYKYLKKDYEETADRFRQHGVLARLAQIGACSTVAAIAVTGAYVAPGFTETVADVIEMEMSVLSGPARALYAQSLTASMDTFSADVLGLVDRVITPIVSNIEHATQGTFLDHHRKWLSDAEILDLPVGDKMVGLLDWSVSADTPDISATKRYTKMAVGAATALVLSGVAVKKIYNLTAKTLDSAALAVSKANDLAVGTKNLALNVFSAMRRGIDIGVSVAMGRGIPTRAHDPFANPTPEQEVATLKENMTERMQAAGLEEDVARALATEVVEQVEVRDRKIEDLSVETETLQDQMSQALTEISELSRKVEGMVRPEDVTHLVQRAIADRSLERSPRNEETPTLH